MNIKGITKRKGYTIELGIKFDDLTLDDYWISEGDDFWFKPMKLDAIHGYYTGYWYSNLCSSSKLHYHSGASHGIILHGSMKFIDIETNEITVTTNNYVYTHYTGVSFKVCK